ncbi:MAG: hypothetical protein DHS20C19_02250 [Acidimicrobiales bacterium]|nr:MAG: hypothetical protein DHS20C19_02250 [Acidimicrobiales bacterium]
MFDADAGLAQLNEALDGLSDADLLFGSARDAAEVLAGLESVARRVRAVQTRVLDEVDRSGVYVSDGHSSAKVMVRHCGRLSPGAAAGRERGVRMSRELGEVFDALRCGGLGVDYFDLLGRVWANPRVRDAMVDAQPWFLRLAARLSYADFEIEVRTWERYADEDGPEPANSRSHELRDFSLVQDPIGLGWTFAGGTGAMQGAQIAEILEHYISAERLSDWEKARAEHGDDANLSHLPRNERQRRADAFWQMCQDAAANPHSVVPEMVHNIVWHQETFEHAAARHAGTNPTPLAPTAVECRTLDGRPLDPTEAFATVFLDKLRRVVVDAAGVVIDLGRARRFTGGARLAAQLGDTHCPWPGCTVPTSQCEIDHSVDHAHGGDTNPHNGGPYCGKHNRWKQKGYAVWRDPQGAWHTYRPDGSEI